MCERIRLVIEDGIRFGCRASGGTQVPLGGLTIVEVWLDLVVQSSQCWPYSYLMALIDPVRSNSIVLKFGLIYFEFEYSLIGFGVEFELNVSQVDYYSFMHIY